MFTGIVERCVPILAVADGPKFRRLTIPSHWDDVKLGDSIALNGCCLTVAELAAGQLSFDVIQESLSRTNLGLLNQGDRVHVERAMRVGDRFDGHFVQGHVDATARLAHRTADQHEWRLTLEPPRELMKYIVPKGSVALDGVSLTVAAVGEDSFEVALIPTTLSITELGNRPIGWPCNFEADMLAKTIVSYLERFRR